MCLWEVEASWRHPFSDFHGMQIIYLKQNDNLQEKIPTTCDPSLAKLITWGWNNDPKQRPTSKQVLSELIECKRNLKK